MNTKVKSAILLILIFLCGISFYCYEFYLRILPGAYADDIMRYFHTGPLGYSFLITSFNFTYLAMQIPAGILLDHFDNKIILPLAVLFCGIGNYVFTTSIYDASLCGRLVLGFGSAFAFVGVLKLCREYLPSRYFTLLTSIVISVGTLAAAYAQQISTMVARSETWQHIFAYSSLVSLIIALFIFMTLTRAKKTPSYHAQKTNKPKNIVHQLFQLVKNRNLIFIGVIGGLLYAPTVVLTAQWGVYFFEHQYGLTQVDGARLVTLILLGWVVFSPVVGYLADRLNRSNSLIVIFTLFSAVTLFVIIFQVRVLDIGWLVFIFGATAAAQVLVWKIFHQMCPSHLTGIGVALMNMVITFVMEAFQLIVGGLMQWKNGMNWFVQLTGYSASIQFASLSLFIGIIFAFLILLRIKNSARA